MPTFHEMREAMLRDLPSHPDIEGLVWAGSSAEVQRADEWSDLDFFVMTRSGAQETMRRDLAWLPYSAEISVAARETTHGLKVLFADGLVLEFAVFDRNELRQAVVNHHELAFGDFAHDIAAIHRPEPAPSVSGLEDHLGLAMSLLVIGVGRARRGERLVAGLGVRTYAVSHLLHAAQLALPNLRPAARDGLDVWRRVEQQFPEFAADLRAAVARDTEEAAWELCEVAERWFSEYSDVPSRAAAVFRKKFGQ